MVRIFGELVCLFILISRRDGELYVHVRAAAFFSSTKKELF